MTRSRIPLVLLLPLVLFPACREHGCLALAATQPLLEHPYPLHYPSTNPRPNRIVGQVGPGQIAYGDIIDGKDYRAFKFRRSDGTHGYVIFDAGVTGCLAPDSSTKR